MKLSKQTLLAAAKSDRESGGWLPLWIHAEDAANVIEYLLHTRYNALTEICGIELFELERVARLLAYLHDIGKLTPLFQARILMSLPRLRGVLEHYGIIIPPETDFINKGISHHSKCGENILKELGFPDDIRSIVGAHHGTPADIQNEPPAENVWGNASERARYEKIYREWADFSLERAGFSSLSEIPALNKRTQVLLCGLLIVSDWIASDETKFGLIDENAILTEDDYPKNRFSDAIRALELPDVWESEQSMMTDADFKERFGFSMNGIQRNVAAIAEQCSSAGLFILEAPMGTGKTEASLAAAEIVSARCGKTGLFFGLPTQATANGIFERVRDWAELQSCEGFHGIELAHGSAEFQSEFAKIQEKGCCVYSDEGSDEGGLVVHPFFSGNKKSLLADFVVGTVDRLLMCALKKKHVMLLHLGISQKVVVIDECHAYDAYMNRYLDRALSWLHEYKVPVILLSATLPAERRLALVNAYLRTELAEEDLPELVYPRLTYTDGSTIKGVSLPLDIPARPVAVTCMSDEEAADEIRRAAAAGACVGVICNTVSRAQSFAELSRGIDGAEVILYHSQFIIPDRLEREETIKRSVGKRSNAAVRKGKIVVGTQVLEQSLDIDFDVLITDLCPMDLLLQRIGRLHRHPRADRPAAYGAAKCIVLGTDKFDASSEKIYTKWLLMRTRELLPELINIPSDIDRLVCDTYKEVEPKTEEETSALDEYDLRRDKKEQKAGAFLMSAPRDRRRHNDLHDLLENGVADNENKALAAVRDGISSVEVIVMVRFSDCKLGLLPWHSVGDKFSPRVCPSDEQCKLIARHKLRLPFVFCQPWNVDKTIDALERSDRELTGFQGSRWLKGELFLLLDESLTAELCGYKIKYSQHCGLECKREE